LQQNLRNKLFVAAVVAAVITSTFTVVTWFVTTNSTTSPELSLYIEITPPKANTNANFSFLLTGLVPTTTSTSSPNYSLTTTSQGTRILIHVHFTSTDSISTTIDSLTTNRTSNPYPSLFKEIPTNTIQSQNLTVYIEYTAQGRWPFGTLPLYRDAYLNEPGFDSPINFSTTQTILLVESLSAGIALTISAIIVAIVIPTWRRELLSYFPWITFTLSFIMIWGLVFIGTPIDYERTLGILPDIFSTIPHFSTDHLLGNLTRGFIIAGVLIETWIGYAEQSIFSRRLQLLISMFLMDTGSSLLSVIGSTLSIGVLQIGGFGASYTVEVWSTLALIIVLTQQKVLQRTSLLFRFYPLLAALSGFALLNYVYEWFLAGFVLGGSASTVELATNHIIAFFLGLGIIALFYGFAFFRKRLEQRGSPTDSIISGGVVQRFKGKDYSTI
jgi:hypothetical protein